nr:hypothetical protein [Paenibacillus sinopodophylli]
MGERHLTRTLLLALGYGVLKLAKLDIEGADRFEVSNLHYTVTVLEVYRNKMESSASVLTGHAIARLHGNSESIEEVSIAKVNEDGELDAVR